MTPQELIKSVHLLKSIQANADNLYNSLKDAAYKLIPFMMAEAFNRGKELATHEATHEATDTMPNLVSSIDKHAEFKKYVTLIGEICKVFHIDMEDQMKELESFLG